MREISSYGLVRVLRSGLRYLVVNGSVVVTTHWTKRAALRAAAAVREEGQGR